MFVLAFSYCNKITEAPNLQGYKEKGFEFLILDVPAQDQQHRHLRHLQKDVHHGIVKTMAFLS